MVLPLIPSPHAQYTASAFYNVRLFNSLRKRKYDSYGFEVEGWADDIVVKAEGLQSKYEQLVSKLHEVIKEMHKFTSNI